MIRVLTILCIGLLLSTLGSMLLADCPPNGPFPHPHITSSFTPDSSCIDNKGNGSTGQPDRHECIYACENQYATYCTANNGGSTYTWAATGGVITAGQGTSCVTVLWGPAGSGSLTVTETNTNGCEGTDLSCVTIINSPIANFTVDTTVCKGVNLNFQDLSVNAATWQWNFGDPASGPNNTSTLQNPTHAYNTGGTYVVTLVVTNHCGCSDSVTKTIHVSNLQGPNIECPATVCAFSKGCYSTFDTCAGAVYHWSVTGGTFTVAPSGTSVCVNWGAGPVGVISLFITGCSNVCPETTKVVVPIIGSTATVLGPAIVCPNDIATYSVPTWPGTYYTWTLSSGGTIIAGAYTQSATVQWGNVNGSYTLSVTWNNILLKCGGTASLPVTVRDRFSIFGPPGPFCVGDSTSFAAIANANWTISGGYSNGPLSNTPSITVHWTTPGVHTIIGSPVNSALYCNLADSLHVVVDSVPKASSITGPQVVCPSTTYMYTATPSGPGYTLQWSTTGGGSIVGSSTANPVTVSWGGPGTIAVQQVRTSAPFCMSDTISIPVTMFSVAGITGPDSVCMDQTTNFMAGLINYPGVDYQWSIVNGPNPSPYGSIVTGQGSNTISVLWHGPGNMTVTVKLTVCGNVYTKTVKIFPLPTPTITMSGHVCDPGGSVILTANPGYTSYSWSNSTTGQSTVVNASGTYTVTVIGPGGCPGTASITVPHTPGPIASISTPNPTHWCIGGPPIRDTLYALQGPGYMYNWTPGNLPGSTIVVTTPGTYTVTVTDPGGCYATSSIIITQDTCQPSNCTPVGTASFTVTTPICNPVQFNGSSTNIPSPSWNFGDPLSGSNTSLLTNPSHLFTSAGWYTVTWGGIDNNGCLVTASQAVPIPLAADFSASGHCDTMNFTDLSTYLPPNGITSWSWSFPGGSPSVGSGQNPGPVTYGSSGPHSVTLTVSNGTCTVSITKTVNVGVLPTATITAPAITCAGTDIAITATGTGVVNWSWNFGDSATSALQNTSHAYAAPGTYTITLTVSDSFGCMTSSSTSITVTPPISSCSITPLGPTIFCVGDSVILKASPGAGYTHQWYLNGNPIPSATGINYTALASGNYTVVVTDPNGCRCTTAVVAVVANPPPPATVSSNIPPIICGSGQITLCAPAGPYTYLWNDPGASTTQCVTMFLNTPGPQTFTVTVTDPSTGCAVTSAPFTVTVFPPPPPPTITASGPTSICKGDSVTLTSSAPSGNFWSTGATTQSITVHNPGVYTVTVTYPGGCTASASIGVKSMDPDFTLFPFGCDALCDSIKLPGPIGPYPGYYTYQWLFNGVPIAAPNGTNDTLTPVGSGLYSLILTSPAPAYCKDTSNAYNLTLHKCDSLQCKGRICGRKWNDANGNHKFNYGTETGIPHWKICLVRCNVDNYPTKDTIACTTTDTNGFYCFNNLCPGDYCVVEQHVPGWQQTWPISPPFYHVTITDSQAVMGLDFGNRKKCIDIWVTLDTIGVPTDPILTYGTVLPPSEPWPLKISYTPDLASPFVQVFEGMYYANIPNDPFLPPCNHGYYSIKRETVANYAFDRIYVNDTLRAEGGDSVIVNLDDATPGVSVVFLNAYAPDTTIRYRTFTAAQLAGSDQVKPIKRPGKGKPVTMPNTANVIDEIFKQQGGLLVGRTGQLNSAGKEKGYLRPGNQSDVFKTLNTKGQTQSQQPPRGLDFINGKPILKRQKNLPPTKFNDVLLGNLLALQVNIAGSMTVPPKMPAGFVDLVYDNGPDDTLSGKTIGEIAMYANDLMTNWEYRSQSVFAHLNDAVEAINAAFAKPLPLDGTDTITWVTGKLQLHGTTPLASVPFLKKVTGTTPSSYVPPPSPGGLEPDRYALYQNYPNPFNPSTTISFMLADPAYVTVTVYDVIGRLVATPIDYQLMDAGFQEVDFNAATLSSGVYFYKMTARGIPAEEGQLGRSFIDIKKMLLLR